MLKLVLVHWQQWTLTTGFAAAFDRVQSPVQAGASQVSSHDRPCWEPKRP